VTVPLSFDIVIATRNRPEALALSIPLMLDQSRQPGKLIVIDSSDDHAPVAQAVARVTAGWDGEVIVEHAAQGSAVQRNIGLAHVTADVVILPDDDSLFHPGASQAIMEVYERDTEGVISGVCAVPDLMPPAGVLPEASYRMTKTHQREARSQRLRSRLDKRLSHLNPAKFVGHALMARQNWPDWVGTYEVPVVEYMTGFRMSFRTDRIRAVGFDETLSGYALNEDIDASLAVAHNGLLVGARPARIYHHRFPGGRPEPYRSSAIGILNPVYVISKHLGASLLTEAERGEVRARLRTFLRLQLLAAVPAVFRSGGGKRLRGALAAYREGFRLLSVPPAELSAAYRAAERRMGL
jgi:glycosyltransferase involved in cell wall biosynthesis